MFSHINVDACKTPGCKNLGILGSPDYLPQEKCSLSSVRFFVPHYLSQIA